MSLRDQLLRAGLATEKQARDAERSVQEQQQRRQHLAKPKRQQPSEQTLSAQRAAQAKAQRDQELNRQQQAKTERTARLAQVRQLIEQNRLPKLESEEYYSFVDGRRIKRIAVDGALRARLSQGELQVVRCDGRYDLVSAEVAARIAERDPRAVMSAASKGAQDAPDAQSATAGAADYAAYAVPDDLMW